MAVEGQLLPVLEDAVGGQEGGGYDTEYKGSVKWDPQLGDFVRDNAGGMAACGGREAFMVWCYKMAQTERYAHKAYVEAVAGADLGTELEEAVQESDHDLTESMVARTVTEALMVNPRTEYVRGFEFLWEGDSLHFTFEVKGAGWDETFHITL